MYSYPNSNKAKENMPEGIAITDNMISVGNMTYKMLFLRGIEKSGTTWLVNTLNLHPQINIAKKEIHFQFIHDAIYSQFSSPVFHGGLPHVKPVVDKLFKQIVSEVLNY